MKELQDKEAALQKQLGDLEVTLDNAKKVQEDQKLAAELDKGSSDVKMDRLKKD